ncbi:MAG: hypothetical protein LUQ11_01065 [Methylococcaceae bacterium]|nr:hypothetical protein [Methylococcaceae bacterium]
MAYPNSNPFYGSSGGGLSANGGQQRLALDNLLRRELKVGDPNDPKQIAEALLNRFKDDPRANAITQEANGLPFLLSSSSKPMIQQSSTSSDSELNQAKDDVEKDLQELTTNALLKDVIPELQGWAQSLRFAIAEGTQAARFSLDPRQRDKAFAIRRQLGDYARIARFVGALTPAINMNYRKFAQSLDEVAAVLLVMMGEALANVGFAGGRFLLQAPYSELQIRRDAVITALRNLVGATQESYGASSWPRGLDGYRRLFDILEAQGQGDLRALLVENELSRNMDELIQRAAHGTVGGLRALGSTAQLDLQRFNRLIAIGHRLVNPESPPLTTFLEALRLFADAFEPGGGFRLLRVARPPILSYGLYGADEIEPADRRLTQLTVLRGGLAGQLDCLMRCECSTNTVLCQIVLDKVLYDVDRSIDLYCVGNDDLGLPEIRAAAYSYVINAAQRRCAPGQNDPLRASLTTLMQNLRPIANTPQVIDWETGPAQFETRRTNNVLVDRSRFTNVMHQELCIQRRAEADWEQLVRQMAPNCIPSDQIFGNQGILHQVIQEAMDTVINGVDPANLDIRCDAFVPDIPADFETALDAFVFNHGRAGQGRP